MMTNLLSSLLSCFRLGIEKQNPNDNSPLKGVTYCRKESIADVTLQEPSPSIEDVYLLVSISDVFGEFLEVQPRMLASRSCPYTLKNGVED